MRDARERTRLSHRFELVSPGLSGPGLSAIRVRLGRSPCQNFTAGRVRRGVPGAAAARIRER